MGFAPRLHLAAQDIDRRVGERNLMLALRLTCARRHGPKLGGDGELRLVPCHSERFCCNDIGSRCAGAVGELSPLGRSCGAIEQVGGDDGLAPDIMTVNLSKLSLPHHRHGFGKPAKVRRAVWKLPETEPRPDKALDTPVVLLDDALLRHLHCRRQVRRDS